MDDINTDTLTVKDGEWSQVAHMASGNKGIWVNRIEVETDKGTVEITGEEMTISEIDGDS